MFVFKTTGDLTDLNHLEVCMKKSLQVSVSSMSLMSKAVSKHTH